LFTLDPHRKPGPHPHLLALHAVRSSSTPYEFYYSFIFSRSKVSSCVRDFVKSFFAPTSQVPPSFIKNCVYKNRCPFPPGHEFFELAALYCFPRVLCPCPPVKRHCRPFLYPTSTSVRFSALAVSTFCVPPPRRAKTHFRLALPKAGEGLRGIFSHTKNQTASYRFFLPVLLRCFDFQDFPP